MIARHRVHHGRRQRRDADRHAETEDDDGGKERRPVRSADARPGEEREAQRRDERPDDERRSRAIAIEQAAGPARQQEHQDDERQERGARRGRRVALHLDQVEWKEEKDAAQCRVQEKREQVGAAERGASGTAPAEASAPAFGARRDRKTGEQERSPATPAKWHRFDQPEHQQPRGRPSPAATPGQSSRFVGVRRARLRHSPERDREDDERDAEIDEEHPAPGQMFDQPAAQHGTERRRDRA